MNITYENIVEYFINEYPEFIETEEFKSFDEEDLKLPYIVTASFARYILARFNKNGPGDGELQKLFQFINEQFISQDGDSEILTLISVEIFENFSLDKKSLEFLRKNTVGNARYAVEMSLTYCGIDKPDLTIAPEAKAILDSITDYNKGVEKPKAPPPPSTPQPSLKPLAPPPKNTSTPMVN